ncbi:Serine acetyltransferase [Indibacter alkaliphilus LW1]|jgi:serine O-acetyltransferase|uniref:Serine acetyltransferase n=1 Tax=Indibacter alkaliphilus (strain CCUG 57479 / KCTC 22604 / LW1) TaxID=1189612 RepID=S2DJB6_INDAL|nr:serine O-acetyltransferase EpsC [Indibacter alkaliphilus]EOZ99154.1 Serine acetyltransferase [Indibacter alkaliphilus LW1]
MSDSLVQKLSKAHKECPECPSPKVIQSFFENILGLLFPDFAHELLKEEAQVLAKIEELRHKLSNLLIKNKHLHNSEGGLIADQFFEELEHVYDLIQKDIQAMYAGDPAAKSITEIIRCYPGFYAIAAYRIAHLLHSFGVNLIPRMITEFAHSRTGIDIHPGAKIGQRFCIDHGTGIVIGETTVIGNDVKIYQGVTLGALSVEKEDADKKRHPTIEEGVVIYAGATILGGNTVIGERSIIGGNVWVTKSIPAFSKIYYQARMYNPDSEQTDTYIIRSQG